MRSARFAIALVAVGLLAWALPTHAGDTVQLNLIKPDGASFADPADNDNLEVHGFRYRRAFRYGGSYGYRSFYRPSYSFGFRYSYRPAYYSSYSYYRPRYYSSYSYYRPRYYSSYYYPRYYSRGFSLNFGIGRSYYYPIGLTVVSSVLEPDCLSTPVAPVAPSVTPSTPAPSAKPVVPPPMPKSDGTFPYDGGPTTPAPMPKADPAPAPAPAPKPSVEVPSTGRLVSHTEPSAGTPKSKWVFPAYGEAPRRTPGR